MEVKSSERGRCITQLVQHLCVQYSTFFSYLIQIFHQTFVHKFTILNIQCSPECFKSHIFDSNEPRSSGHSGRHGFECMGTKMLNGPILTSIQLLGQRPTINNCWLYMYTYASSAIIVFFLAIVNSSICLKYRKISTTVAPNSRRECIVLKINKNRNRTNRNKNELQQILSQSGCNSL